MAAASNKKPVMDVSKPGDVPADATARPIITGHAIMKDPMVTKDTTEEKTVPDIADEAPKEAVAPSAAKKVIQPLASQAEETKDTKPTDETKPEKPAESAQPDTEITEGAVVDAVLEQVGDKKKQDTASQEEQKRQELVEKLVEEKKYFVPIGETNAKRNGKLALILLTALLPLLIGLAAAADAGLINPGFKLPFDFIKDKSTSATPVQAPSTQTKPATLVTTLIDVPSVTTTKEYVDTAKVYSLKYPTNWTANINNDGSEAPLPDPAKVSRVVQFVYPNSVDPSGVVVQADTTGSLLNAVQEAWKTNNHAPQTKTINGYTAQYVQVVFKGDAESYTDENYLITKGNVTLFVIFRQKYYHQSPATNWDASKAIPGFETILNSIKILK